LDKQILRAGRHKNVTLKKTGKKGDFATALSSAAEAAGGNISAPKCGSNSSSSNAGVMKFKNILGTLGNCSEKIKAACSTNMPKAPNDTEIQACATKVKEYKKKMDTNANKTDLCTAFGDDDTKAKYAAILKCIKNKNTGNNMTIKDWANKVTDVKKKCIPVFVACRKSEREVGPNIQTCSKTKATILKSLNKLNKNNKSANTVKAKVKNLTSSSGRYNRALDTCAKVVVEVKTFTTKLGQNPESDVTSETTSISGITLAVGYCKNDNDLKSLDTTLDKIITDLAAKISILQAQIKTLTGSNASASEIAAAASSTAGTTASGRRRRESLRKILNKVNMD